MKAIILIVAIVASPCFAKGGGGGGHASSGGHATSASHTTSSAHASPAPAKAPSNTGSHGSESASVSRGTVPAPISWFPWFSGSSHRDDKEKDKK